MKVVAEGVEDGHGWDRLETMGCDDAQGYFISPPLEPAALLEWMREHDGVDIRTQPQRVGSTMGGFRGA
jgi:EAL domain-containing protein (putative c-di-GMP-specific phosphodiesterase class I)